VEDSIKRSFLSIYSVSVSLYDDLKVVGYSCSDGGCSNGSSYFSIKSLNSSLIYFSLISELIFCEGRKVNCYLFFSEINFFAVFVSTWGVNDLVVESY